MLDYNSVLRYWERSYHSRIILNLWQCIKGNVGHAVFELMALTHESTKNYVLKIVLPAKYELH